MKFDLFLSICQTEVDGFMPTERQMWGQFFDQVQLADDLGFETAWVAETHLSCQTQKDTSYKVIPHFKGEIGLNTDILQLAHVIFSKTKKINVGSAIRNILCNGGPMAHAEAIRTFLSLHGLTANEKRRLKIGFASGRFEFSNRPYGIVPRYRFEELAWPQVKNKALHTATEIFLRFLRGDTFSSQELPTQFLRREDFSDDISWGKVVGAYAEIKKENLQAMNEIPIDSFWSFEKSSLIPKDAPMNFLDLVLGSHDPELQILANQFLPVGVFNLSITPPAVIEETHQRMQKNYHKSGGPWQRDMMPRTAMIFLDDTAKLSLDQKNQRAKEMAERAWSTYWTAMEGTLDPRKVDQAVSNTLAGSPDELARQIKDKYDSNDRLMLWFDFNNHHNDQIKSSMVTFMKKVAPQLKSKVVTQ